MSVKPIYIVILSSFILILNVNALDECYDVDTETCHPDCTAICEAAGCNTMTAEEGSVCTPIESQCYCNTVNASTPISADGLGYGDCDCDKDYGLIEMTLRYYGNGTATNISFYVDGYDSDIVCFFENVGYYEEFTCNIWDFGRDPVTNETIYTDFDTNTDFRIVHEDGSVCDGAYHTSCSRDIVGYWSGEYGDCDELFCTGWKDGNPSTDECNDGLEPCDCSETPPPTTTAAPINCYCSNLNTTMYGNPPVNPNTGGLGWGDCDCSGGMIELRWQYVGTGTVDIRVYETTDVVCNFTNVTDLAEIACNIIEETTDPATGTSPYQKFEKNTYFEIEHLDGSICSGSFHTSCSQDIVGEFEQDGVCLELVCTGWKDGNPDTDDCDDGLEPCDCPWTSTTTGSPESTSSTATSSTTLTTFDDPCNAYIGEDCSDKVALGECCFECGTCKHVNLCADPGVDPCDSTTSTTTTTSTRTISTSTTSTSTTTTTIAPADNTDDVLVQQTLTDDDIPTTAMDTTTTTEVPVSSANMVGINGMTILMMVFFSMFN